MESNIRTIRWIMHLKIKFTWRSQDTSIWTDCIVQHSHFHQDSCRHIHMTWEKNVHTKQLTSPTVRSVSLHIIGNQNFESELGWCFLSVNAFKAEILINKVEIVKKTPGLRNISTTM